MLFAIFVAVYLRQDAPAWVWALALAGFAYDVWQERRAAAAEARWRRLMLFHLVSRNVFDAHAPVFQALRDAGD